MTAVSSVLAIAATQLHHPHIKVMSKSISSRTVRLKRPPPVFVCRKCLKRADDGKAIKRALKDQLKARAKAGAAADTKSRAGETKTAHGGKSGGKKIKSAKLVMTSCFGLCPEARCGDRDGGATGAGRGGVGGGELNARPKPCRLGLR